MERARCPNTSTAERVECPRADKLKWCIHADGGKDDPNTVAAADPANDLGDGNTTMTTIEEKGKVVQDSSVTERLYYDLESVGGRNGSAHNSW